MDIMMTGRHENGSKRISSLLKRQRKEPVIPKPTEVDSEHEYDEVNAYFEQYGFHDDPFHQPGFDVLSYYKSHDPANTPSSEAAPAYNNNVGINKSMKFEIDLSDILGRHRTDLSLFDEIVTLIKTNSDGKKLNFLSDDLKRRARFLNDLEERFATKGMRPKDITVNLSDGREATVAVFDVEAMILSLLTDESLMHEDNLAPGYDLHTGKPTEPVTHYGEVHTGDAWEPARNHYCGDYEQNMPIALIIFGDKSHFDKHGSLSTTPICFTLSCFNQSARNKVDFWRPVAYLPNLNHGAVESKKSTSTDSVQDEHNCISVALESLINIGKQGGISFNLKGKAVIGKVWIHYIIGDIQGNN